MGILNSLHHPHVTKYLHAACRASELRIFMEYAEGGSLADEIKKHRALATRWDAGHSERPFQTARVIKWMRQLTSALQVTSAHCHYHTAANTTSSTHLLRSPRRFSTSTVPPSSTATSRPPTSSSRAPTTSSSAISGCRGR